MQEPDPFQSDPRERTENLVTSSVAGAMCAHIKEKILKKFEGVCEICLLAWRAAAFYMPPPCCTAPHRGPGLALRDTYWTIRVFAHPLPVLSGSPYARPR